MISHKNVPMGRSQGLISDELHLKQMLMPQLMSNIEFCYCNVEFLVKRIFILFPFWPKLQGSNVLMSSSGAGVGMGVGG